MRTTLEDQDYSAGAYVSFSPIPVTPRPGGTSGAIGIVAIAILFLLGGALALTAVWVGTRPYQIEAQEAKSQAAIATKEASAAKAELNRVRRCVSGG